MEKLLFFLMIFTSSFCFRIAHVSDRHLPQSDRDIINAALTEDEFFSGMVETKVLGQGGFGVALEMSKVVQETRKYYAIKVGNDKMIQDYSEDISDELMTVNPEVLSNTTRATRTTDYLRQQKMPLVTYAMTFRYIVFKRQQPVPQPQMNQSSIEHKQEKLKQDSPQQVQEVFNPIGLKVVQAIELCEEGNLFDLSKKIKTTTMLDGNAKLRFVKDIFYKTVLVLFILEEKGFLHADIKEENIFAIAFDKFGGKYAPVLGDWDFAFYYKTGFKPKGTRYTAPYRPPELWAKTNQYNLIDTGPFGYAYTGSEDIYALSVAMLGFMRHIESNIDEKMTRLLTMMASPNSFDDLLKLTEGSAEQRKDYARQKGNDIAGAMSEEFQDMTVNIQAKAKKIIEAIRDNFESGSNEVVWIKQHQDTYYTKGDQIPNPFYGNFYQLFQRFFSHFNLSEVDLGAYFKDLIDKGILHLENDIAAFFRLESDMSNKSQFTDIIKRPTYSDILFELVSDLYDVDEDNESDKIQEHYNILINYGKDLTVTQDPLKSHVYVDPSFYDLSLAQMDPMTRFFHSFRTQQPGNFGNPITMPDDTMHCYSTYEFCGQLRTQISEFITQDNANFTKEFRYLSNLRRQRKLKSTVKNAKRIGSNGVKTII